MRTLLLLLPLLASRAPAQTWTQLPDFPGTARDDAASFTIGTKIYVGTGMEVGWGLTNDWWCYDVATGSWSAIAAMPATPRQYCAAFAVNDTGYVFGGQDGTGALNELWMYDPANNTWAQRASLPAPARYAAAAFSFGDHGFIATGNTADGAPTNELWRYDPAMDTWEQRAAVPGPARHRAAAFVNMVPAVVGGADANDQPLADGYRYDVWTDAWTAMAPMPAARFSLRASEGIVTGGSSSFTEEHADAWYYAYFSDSWTVLPDFGGGARRGGVGQWVTYFGLSGFYYGLGLHGADRFNDWWRLDLETGMAEMETTGTTLYPNPATDHLTIKGSPNRVRYAIRDATGRTAKMGMTGTGMAINLSELCAGRYLMVLNLPKGDRHFSFVKLP